MDECFKGVLVVIEHDNYSTVPRSMDFNTSSTLQEGRNGIVHRWILSGRRSGGFEVAGAVRDDSVYVLLKSQTTPIRSLEILAMS